MKKIVLFIVGVMSLCLTVACDKDSVVENIEQNSDKNYSDSINNDSIQTDSLFGGVSFPGIIFDKYEQDGIVRFDKDGGIDTIMIMNYSNWHGIVYGSWNKNVTYERPQYPLYEESDVIASWYELRHTEPIKSEIKSRIKIVVKPNDTGKERRDTISISIYTTSRPLTIIQDK